MRRLLLFASVIMLAACSTKYEQPVEEVKSVSKNSFKVSEEEAIKRLEKMLSVFDPATRGKKRTIKEIIPRVKPQTRAYAAEIPDTMYYYVNFDDNDGYAIVAADERAIPILALIDTGNYVPPQAHIDRTNAIVDSLDLIYPPEEDDDDFWCFQYEATFKTEEMIEDLCDGYISDLSPYSKEISYQDTVRQVGPLLKTKWQQSFPYNARCQNYLYLLLGYNDPNAPTDFTGYYISDDPRFDICASSSYTSATGCDALALAQICAYHQHPARSPYDNHQYDWGCISNTTYLLAGEYSGYPNKYYLDSDWDLSIRKDVSEISHLIKTIGLASNTVYGVEESSSRVNWAKSAMNDILSYIAVKEKGFNEDNILNELNSVRPIYICGRTKNLRYGHAWVIDGYRQFKISEYEVFYKDDSYNEELGRQIIQEYNTHYYHCNYGWGGTANGYYLAELFKAKQGPEMPSDGEASGTTGAENLVKQFRCLYISPNK
ncbi:MAG: C10 family peptidase [Alistipes sp.]|nr:C10 family peptidase [Alistipes sp.]